MTPRSRSLAPRAVVDRRREDVSADEVKAQDRPVTQPAPWPAWIQLCGTGLGSDVPPKLYQQLAAHCCGDHPAIQAKLTVGPPGDRFEREAERVADAVVQREGEPPEGEPPEGEPPEGEPGGEMIMPLLQRQPAEPEEGEEEDSAEQAGELRGRRTGSHVSPGVPPSFAGRLRRAQSGGEPLPAQTRASMEAAFGASFKAVRTHSDADAAELSRTIGAAAFTHGTHIFLGANRLDPHGQDGRRLLAHELTHVIQQNPHVPAPAAAVMRAPAGVLQRDGQPGAGGGPPAETAKRQASISFFGDKDELIVTLPYIVGGLTSSLKPGPYKCVVTSDTIRVKGRTGPFWFSDPQLGRELLKKTRRTVLMIPDAPGKPGAGEEEKKPGAGGEPGPEPGKAGAGDEPGTEEGEPSAGGSKYGWLGLIHPPKWLTRALDKTIERLGLNKEILGIKALLTALRDLYDHRAELGSLFTMEKLLGVLFGIEGGAGIKALEDWATGPAPAAPAAGGGAEKGGITDVTARLVQILGVIRKVLQPIFRVRKAFTAVAAGIAAILDKVPLVEDLLSASAEERKTKDFEELIGQVADDVSEQVKTSLEAVRGRVDLVAEKLTDDVYVTAEELARAIAFVAEKFLPPEGKAVTWVASVFGADVPREVADNLIAPLIPQGALDEINGVVRSVLDRLEPLKKAVTEAIDDILAGIEAEVHDVLAPELKTLFAQLSPLDGSAGGGLAPVGHVKSELAASPGQPLPQNLRGDLAGELGADFSDVRVHADAHSARAADTLGAKAFTVGRDVFFGPGRYAPAAPEGLRLLAHELTHVVQQAQGAPAGTVQRAPKDTVTRKLGHVIVPPIVAALRGAAHVSSEVAYRAGVITNYVKTKLAGSRVGERQLPVDAYYYVTKGNIPVGIRRKGKYAPVVPKLRIAKGVIRLADQHDWFKNSSRRKLARALKCRAGEQAHHVIPLELYEHEVVVAAVLGGFDFNGKENGICLDIHEGSHPKYTKRVQGKLDAYRIHKTPLDKLAGVRKVAAYQQKVLGNRTERLD